MGLQVWMWVQRTIFALIVELQMKAAPMDLSGGR
jgi:hypothetical protein